MKIHHLIAVAAIAFASSISLRADDASPAPASSAAPDFGDYSSTTLTGKAWKAMESNDTELVKTYTKKCIDSFQGKAEEMQKGITGPIDTGDKEKVFANWALNDVGTCYFILGEALEKSGDKKGAIEAYKTLSTKFPDAKCWDPKGWFWAPADAAKGKLKALEFDSVS